MSTLSTVSHHSHLIGICLVILVAVGETDIVTLLMHLGTRLGALELFIVSMRKIMNIIG